MIPSSHDNDKDLHVLVVNYKRLWRTSIAVLALVLLTAGAALGVIIWNQGQQLQVQRARLSSSCAFFEDLSRINVAPVPPLKRPNEVIVALVADSHSAAIGFGCPNVPRLSAETLRWADYYKIPVEPSPVP